MEISLNVIPTEKCLFGCDHCEGCYDYKAFDMRYFPILERFAKYYRTKIVIEGRECMLDPETTEKFLKICLPVGMMTTGVVRHELLETWLLEYPIHRLLISCLGTPENEKKLRKFDGDASIFYQRRWVNKYLGTPLGDKIWFSHVIYLDSILDGSAIENLRWIAETYPQMGNMIVLFDTYQNWLPYKEHLEEFKKVLKLYNVHFPTNDYNGYVVNTHGEYLQVLGQVPMNIHFKDVDRNMDSIGDYIKGLYKVKEEVNPCHNISNDGCPTCTRTPEVQENCRFLIDYYNRVRL